ncbi:fumarylacetoacetate hydrolase family protein [Cellulomonas denverensis]|uniref:Fumarylacetoacetate hydrolase family protein n=1 Tax=Cellulomonas denverensis TaxID=264297 RepID=A0A7X6KUF5_9CELL|nr:fumarylacetoacetate hydrolase family protein [Cellulomonas denverensis]NKY22275.1 fumarylacetoacetate hydrolase family protein [Cellulomonas denverensis]GIG26942.1 2-hydroxyhepta-2,4-diene-1,7-dioate isomerase [Cellulomonas denverensis]
MRFSTIRLPEGGTRAVRAIPDPTLSRGTGHPLDGWAGELLDAPDLDGLIREGRLTTAATTGERIDLGGADLAPVIGRPGKIVCVGLNYRSHITEMGRPIPDHPTLFAKYPEALIGAHDPIALPPESAQVDWEGELAVVVGSRVRRASPDQARAAIAGFAVLNDVTMRDWQYRSPMWLAGKTWENSTPIGPLLATPDELRPEAELVTTVDDREVQRIRIDDLVFDPAALIADISTIVTLNPGDVIASGTPGGVGHARRPAEYLRPGQVLRTSITGLGGQVNRVIAEPVTPGYGSAT